PGRWPWSDLLGRSSGESGFGGGSTSRVKSASRRWAPPPRRARRGGVDRWWAEPARAAWVILGIAAPAAGAEQWAAASRSADFPDACCGYTGGRWRLSRVQEPSSGRGAVVAHLLWEQGVPSSNLGAPT